MNLQTNENIMENQKYYEEHWKFIKIRRKKYSTNIADSKWPNTAMSGVLNKAREVYQIKSWVCNNNSMDLRVFDFSDPNKK